MFAKLISLFKSDKKTKYQNKCALVVDDSPVDRMLHVKIVERLGFKVITAQDGEAGLKLARQARPDLIILDCAMPNIDGPEMCRQLKSDPQLNKIPVLFITGSETPKNVIECFEAEAVNYLHKPIQPKFLASQIDMIFEEDATQQPL